MPQFIIRDLPEETERLLRRRAELSGRTPEAEAGALLRAAVGSQERPLSNEPFGTELLARLRSSGLTDDDWEEFDRSLTAARQSRGDSIHRRIDFMDPKWD